MLVLLLGPGVGLVAGWLLGGRIRNMGEVHLRAIWLIWIAAALQLMQYWTPYRHFFENTLGFSAVLVSYLVLAVWLVGNVAVSRGALRMALGVVTVGWLLNYLVIATDGAMPVSRRALREAGVAKYATRNAVADGHLFKHVLATSTTRLSWLGDILPLRALHSVLSVGDVFLWFGVGLTVAVAMRPAGARVRA